MKIKVSLTRTGKVAEYKKQYFRESEWKQFECNLFFVPLSLYANIEALHELYKREKKKWK